MTRRYDLENDIFRIRIAPDSGAVESMLIKPLDVDPLGETRLASAFALRLQLPDYLCNYTTVNTPDRVDINGQAAEIHYDGINTEKGTFPLSLTTRIALEGDAIRFGARLTNASDYPVAEFWYPQLGGLTGFGCRQDTEFFWPGYLGPHYTHYFTEVPTQTGLGASYPEEIMGNPFFPWVTMPWFDLYNRALNKGLYFGYHDPIYRIHAHHFSFRPCPGPITSGENWVTKELLGTDEPIGIVYSHLRFPYITGGETFEAGEFVLKFHDGDWHDVAPFYRKWFTDHFELMEKPSWLRRKTVWFSGMLLGPEDRINTDYDGMAQWAREAKTFDIDTVEICAWDKGGQDRDYPEYVPEPRLGGEAGFKGMLQQMKADGLHPVLFANYNALDTASPWFKEELHKFARHDEYGCSENWLAAGQNTIQGRFGLSVRRQLWASASCRQFWELIEKYFVELAQWGVDALQLDKTGSSDQMLDFNPRTGAKPDVVMPEGTVRAVEYLLRKCRQVNPNFCFATEASSDRYLPFADVYYRGGCTDAGSSMRYVFPEWTTCVHINNPFDFAGVNAALRFGSVIVIEPLMYQAGPNHPQYRKLLDYIAAVTRLREPLKDILFLGRWLDDRDAEIRVDGQVVGGRSVSTGTETAGIVLLDDSDRKVVTKIAYSTHVSLAGDRHALVIVNNGSEPQNYQWRFTHEDVPEATLHAPFESPRTVRTGEDLSLPPQRCHVIVA